MASIQPIVAPTLPMHPATSASRSMSTSSTSSRKRSVEDGPESAAKRARGREIIEHASKEKQRERFIPTPEQAKYLEEVYIVNSNPTLAVRKAIAAYLGVDDVKKITTWFSNRNAPRRELATIPDYTPPEPDAIANVVPDMAALFAEPGVIIIPAFLFRMHVWTQALAFNGGPVDFAVGLRASPPTLLVVTMYEGTPCRLSIPAHSLIGFDTYKTKNKSCYKGSLAIRGIIPAGACRFARLRPSGWKAVPDFTKGSNIEEARFEIMGWKADINEGLTNFNALLARYPAPITTAVHNNIHVDVNAAANTPSPLVVTPFNNHTQVFQPAPLDLDLQQVNPLPTPLPTATFAQDVSYPFAFNAPGTSNTSNTTSDMSMSRDPTPALTPGSAPAATPPLGLGIDVGVDPVYSNYSHMYAPLPTAPTSHVPDNVFTAAVAQADGRPATAAPAAWPVPPHQWGTHAADVTLGMVGPSASAHHA